MRVLGHHAASLLEEARSASRVNASTACWQRPVNPMFASIVHNRAAHHHAVRELRHFGHLLRLADAETHGERQVCMPAHALNQRDRLRRKERPARR